MKEETKVSPIAQTERSLYGIIPHDASPEHIWMAYAEASEVFERVTRRQLNSYHDEFY